MTKLHSQEVIVDAPCKTAEKWLMDRNNIITNLPFVVGIKGDEITLKFNRMGLFSYKDVFTVELGLIGRDFIEYKLKAKASLLEIMFSLSQGAKDCSIKIMLKYVGEKEWIVGKALPIIGDGMAKTIKDQIKEEQNSPFTGIDFGNLDLGKISDVSKILLKSKLEKSESVNVSPNLAVYLENQFIDLAKYPVVYISGLGEGISFRVLMLNGEFKGVYINDGNAEIRDETALNNVKGQFNVNVYVYLTAVNKKRLEEQK